MMKTAIFITAFALSVALSTAGPAALAQNEETGPESELEDLIDGFEEPAAPAAATPSGEDDLLHGFEDNATEIEAPPTPAEKEPAAWQIEGAAAFTGIYNISPEAASPWQGVTMLRPELDLTLKNKFSRRWQGRVSVWGYFDAVYAVRGRDDYTTEVLDEYEQEVELRDTYIQGRLTDSVDLKVGRQVVVWGTLDNLRATDVLNPMDLRVPGLTDIEDLRLPVTMLKLDYYFGNWNLSGLVMPEVRFSKRPVYGSDFYPYAVPAPPEEKPDNGFENVPYAAALKGVFSGMDVGFYWADMYADRAYLAPAEGAPGQYVRRYPRMQMLGAAGDAAFGNWLIKGEAAWFDGLRYTNRPGDEYRRVDLGGGVEYTGLHETSISLEAVNRHLCDYDSGLALFPDEVREDEFQWSLRIARDLLHDTLTLTLLASTFGVKADDGAFERLEAEYDITDAFSIRGGFVFYQSGDQGPFQDIAANDRLFVVLKSSF